MLSKNQIKLIKSLETKKNRKREGLFVAEGPKVVGDLLRAGYQPHSIFTTSQPSTFNPTPSTFNVTDDELHRISFLQHPQEVLAVFHIPTSALNPPPSPLHPQPHTLNLALDGVQDPGNVGTIIRIADWFGITQIYCSPDSADVYNPKVVQATMGSIARLNITYFDTLCDYLSTLPSGIPVYGAVLDGENIYTSTLTPHGVIIMGNEGNGISAPVREMLTHKLLIPQGGNEVKGQRSKVKGENCQLSTVNCQLSTAESLNVSIATAIILSEFRRPST